MPYHPTHSGWMVLGFMADYRPHNPLVAGSSPANQNNIYTGLRCSEKKLFHLLHR